MCEIKRLRRGQEIWIRLETRIQYGVRNDQYEVLKSSVCLQAQIMFLLSSLASPFTFNGHALQVLLHCPLHSCFAERKVEAVTLTFRLLSVKIQEEREQKLGKGKPLALQPVLNTQNTDPNSNPLHHRCPVALSLDTSE